MDLVTITDHDSIGGCLELLDHHPDAKDIFISEEVSCWLPGTGIQVHLGVYGTNEQIHRELQPLRRDAYDVIAYLHEAGVCFALNHLLHFYRGQIPIEDYLRLLDRVPALEVRNGTMLPAHNELIARIAATWRGGQALGATGGSDAHTLRRIALTWTGAPADDVTSFLESVKRGDGRPDGAHGGVGAVAGDAYGVVARYCGSLIGMGPCEQSALRRAACLAFSVVSLPAQFVPVALVASGKRQEAREVRRLDASLDGALAARFASVLETQL